MTTEAHGDAVTLVAHYEPRLACEKCHRPWRLTHRLSLRNIAAWFGVPLAFWGWIAWRAWG